MNPQISLVEPDDYPELVAVWEDSVRATHDFLQEADIQYFKPLILNTYLDAVELRCVKDAQGSILGFSGVAEGNLEMLFIHSEARGQGIGKALLNHAIEALLVRKVDVNEQNDQALGFYLHAGFRIVSRSERDASGKPYPILHMELNMDHKA
ncbi:GNAT family N-acetyltransferase [Pontibacter sp. G13]|uniref:GNAT family N-acetyltransferase n=1 Tax=Pontibacter sp. G13 TaxID=3074898 RepID=UPI00288A9929|nr:GNAT family N-acetyltransferase [Pontibacter sp. G13]WNJ19492.1 GNAT family N-acetyltransferase [Pontibacter sp. G13]